MVFQFGIGIAIAISISDEDRDRDRDLDFGDRGHALAATWICNNLKKIKIYRAFFPLQTCRRKAGESLIYKESCRSKSF